MIAALLLTAHIGLSPLTVPPPGLSSSAGATLPAANCLKFNGRSQVCSAADSNLTLKDTAGTAFTMLQFGGATSSFPSIKRAGATLVLQLADDSGVADFTARQGSFSDNTSTNIRISGTSLLVELGSTTKMAWGSGAATGTKDTGVSRVAAGEVGLTKGTSGQGNLLTGGLRAAIRSISSTDTLTADDFTILCDATSGTVTINAPAAASHTGRMFNIKKIDASANSCTFDPNGAETVDGAATLTNTTQNQSRTVQASSTAWFVL